MKQTLFIALLFIFAACEDKVEDIYRYSRSVSQSKTYPVYLDMSDIGNIQVKSSMTPVAPFKIVANDKYYFVGEMMKGIHVYEKTGEHAVNYLCFIECKYLKAFDVIDNHLFCNNFIDLVVLDVSNPLQTVVAHRQKNYFNRFSSYASYWNISSEEGKGCIVDYQQEALSGIVTDEQPNLDFTEYDQLYGNLTTKDIPASWISDNPENDKPYLGIAKAGDDKIYTFGQYNSWAICSYQGGTFRFTEEDLWTNPPGNYNYAPPYYYNDAHPIRLINKDGILYILGSGNYSSRGYFDCIFYNTILVTYSNYFPDYMPVDITYIPSMHRFFTLFDDSIRSSLVSENIVYQNIQSYSDYKTIPGAVAITETQDKLITLGSVLSVSVPTPNDIQILKIYPDISGSCLLKEDNVLAVANRQGLFFYDISNLENITRIP